MRKGKKGTPHLLFPIHYPGFQAFVLIYKTYIGSHLYFSPHHRATPSADVINNQFWRLPRSYPRRPRPLPTSTLRSPVASPSESPRLPPIFFKVCLTTSLSVRFKGRSALLDLAIMAATGTMVGLALTSSLGGGEFQVLAHEAMRSTHHAQGPNPPNSCSISPPSWRPCRATERVVRSFPARRHIPVLGCHS
jgi:hypothetical protein